MPYNPLSTNNSPLSQLADRLITIEELTSKFHNQGYLNDAETAWMFMNCDDSELIHQISAESGFN